MQQTTEMWKKACHQRMKHCLVWFCQLMLTLPLWLSMLLLLIDGDPNRKQREHNVAAYATIQKALHDLFDEVMGLLS
jgi:hypothetical protein